MNETIGWETSNLLTAHRDNTDTEMKARILTQDEFDKQIKTYITPFAKHSKDWTQLIQGMSVVHRQNFSSRAIISANSSAADLWPVTHALKIMQVEGSSGDIK